MDVVEPTLIAFSAEAGDTVHASMWLFPAAATTFTPLLCASLTARLVVMLTPPTSDRERIAGLPPPLPSVPFNA